MISPTRIIILLLWLILETSSNKANWAFNCSHCGLILNWLTVKERSLVTNIHAKIWRGKKYHLTHTASFGSLDLQFLFFLFALSFFFFNSKAMNADSFPVVLEFPDWKGSLSSLEMARQVAETIASFQPWSRPVKDFDELHTFRRFQGRVALQCLRSFQSTGPGLALCLHGSVHLRENHILHHGLTYWYVEEISRKHPSAELVRRMNTLCSDVFPSGLKSRVQRNFGLTFRDKF